MSEQEDEVAAVARVIEKAIEKLPHERRLFPDLYAAEVAQKVLPLVENVRREARAQMLEDLAALMESDDWDHKDDWGVPVIYPNALQVRAKAIREDRPLDEVYAEAAKEVLRNDQLRR